ncbi:sulfatase [Patescibacteria group bacterium]
MKKKTLYLIALFIFLGVAFITQKKPVSPRKHNLILISFDALQAKHLNKNGYYLDSTPNLDKFLEQSYFFPEAISPSSWTVPATMSVFTSMYPSEHMVLNKFSDYNVETKEGVIANLQKLSPAAVTLADILKKEGYLTAGFTGDAGVGSQFGFDQGFDVYDDGETFGGFNDSMSKALSWLEQNKNKPFFLFVHGYDLHGQSEPEEGFDYRYVTKPYNGEYTGSKAEQAKLREDGLAQGYLEMSEEDTGFWRAIYDEKINNADAKFKTFMDGINKLGLMDNTVIVLFSDHGTEFYEHKRFDHGFSLYGELLNVLFAVHQPGQKQGKTINQLVNTLDMLPTTLNLLGIKNSVPEQTKGIDLTAAFDGKNLSHEVFSETDYRLYTFKRSLQTPDGWKFILTLENGDKELYNLLKDPDEQNNLIKENPQKGYELEQKLWKHIDSIAGDRNNSQLGCSPVYGNQCQ